MSQPEWMKKYQEVTKKSGPAEEENIITASEDDDAAALFRSAGNNDPPADDGSDGGNSEEAIDEPAPESDTLTSGLPSTNTGYSSGMPSTTDSSNMQSSMAESSTGIHSSTTVSKDEDLRGSDINSTAAAEAASYNPGESFITEEVLVDEDGNEIIVLDEKEIPEEEAEEEIEEEEVLVDEDGNEIEEEPAPAPTPAPVVKSRAVDYSAENFVEKKKPRAIIYDDFDIEDQQRILGVGTKKGKSRMSWCVPLLLLALILAGVLFAIFYIFYGEKPNFGPPTPPPTATKYQPNGNDAAATTVFDRLRNNCSLSAKQPNFIDQCNCKGSVDILADDIRERWDYYVETFIPEIYPDWDDSIDSCSAENQALLWLSSGINNGGEISFLYRQQRYLLAVVFFKQGGVKWARITNWLSEKDVCTWEGVGCNGDDYVNILDLDDNKMTGEVSECCDFILVYMPQFFDLRANVLNLFLFPSLAFRCASEAQCSCSILRSKQQGGWNPSKRFLQ